MEYEKSLKRLEEIVSQLESKNISLSESINLYKEGSVLVKKIHEMLDSAEREVAVLSEINDKIVKEEFKDNE